MDKMIKQIEDHTGKSVEELRKLNKKESSRRNIKTMIDEA
jgi:hypothetical protein